MDLSIPIISMIGLAGYILNTGFDKKSRNIKPPRATIPKNQLPSSKNVYKSTRTKDIAIEERNLVEKSYYLKECDNKKCKSKKNIIDTRPMFSNTTVNIQDFSNIPPKNINVRKAINNGKLSSLSGTPIKKFHSKYATPSFGKSITQNTCPSANLNRFSKYVGENEKQERDPQFQFFENVKQSVEPINTIDVSGDNRFNTSMYKNNENILPKIYTNPISQYDWRNLAKFKSIDELRVYPQVSHHLRQTQEIKEHITYSNLGEFTSTKPKRNLDSDNYSSNVSGQDISNYYYNNFNEPKRRIPTENRRLNNMGGSKNQENIQGIDRHGLNILFKEQQRETIDASRMPNLSDTNRGTIHVPKDAAKETYRQYTLYNYIPNPEDNSKPQVVRDSYYADGMKFSDKADLTDLTCYKPTVGREDVIKNVCDINIQDFSKLTVENYVSNPDASRTVSYEGIGEINQAFSKDIVENCNNRHDTSLTRDFFKSPDFPEYIV